jgi:cyclopropane-fatty-acyl-phospholipid synthase
VTVAPERVAANHWPGLDVVPSGPRAAVSARIARRLFHAAIGRLDVTVVEGDASFGRGGPTMVITRPEEFYARIGRHQLIGFGEAYLTGAWDAEDLGGFLRVLAAEMQHLVPESLQRLRSVVVKRPPRRQRSSTKNSRNNIAHHYDLSNDLFELFLDPTLSYSSALYAGDPATAAAADLEAAQGRKIERLLDQAGVGEGTRLLEIGSGWGELCIRAARRGATVTSITLSTEQQSLGRERVAAAAREHGFSADQVSIELCDYRDVVGSYDAVVSV